MMFHSDDHLIALQVFLSDADPHAKRKAILQSTQHGPSSAELDNFLAQPQTVDSFLEFVSTVDARRAELPLVVRNHMRHMRYNPLLAASYVPIEPRTATVPAAVPDEVSYVLRRLDESEGLSLPSGWVLTSRARRRELCEAYMSRAREKGVVDTVWDRGATIVGEMYIGMGHFKVLAVAPDGGFFTFVEGGANGLDRDVRFEEAATTTRVPERGVAWTILAAEDC